MANGHFVLCVTINSIQTFPIQTVTKKFIHEILCKSVVTTAFHSLMIFMWVFKAPATLSMCVSLAWQKDQRDFTVNTRGFAHL